MSGSVRFNCKFFFNQDIAYWLTIFVKLDELLHFKDILNSWVKPTFALQELIVEAI